MRAKLLTHTHAGDRLRPILLAVAGLLALAAFGSALLQDSRAGAAVRANALLLSAPNVPNVPAAAGIPRPDHVVIVMEENHSYSEIIGSPQATYINSLANGGALFTNSHGVTHPSQPNYLYLFSGSSQGSIGDECPPTGSPYSAANLGGELLAASLSFTGYSEDLPAPGSPVCSSGKYYRKHNPWVNFPSLPTSTNQPFTSYPSDYSTLPALSFVVPNQDHDMHDGTIAQADAWLQAHLDGYAQWAATHNSLLIVTWDEDDSSSGNQIPTIFTGPMVVQGHYSEAINHLNVLRTLEDMFDLPYAGGSAGAVPISDVWTGGVTPTPSLTATPAANTPTPAANTPTPPASTATAPASATPLASSTSMPTSTPGTTSTPTQAPPTTNTGTATPIATQTTAPTIAPSVTSILPTIVLPTITLPALTATPAQIPSATANATLTPGLTSTTVASTATAQPTNTPNATTTSVATAVATLTTVPTLAPTSTACTLRFADVPTSNTFYPTILCLACRGIVSGYPCGGVGEPCNGGSDPYFRYNNPITRGQISKIVALSAGYSDDPGGQVYADVAPASPFYIYINRLSNHSVMGGYPCGGVGEPCDGGNRPYFRPNANASRGQLSKIVANAAVFTEPHTTQTFEDVPTMAPFYLWIERLASHGAIGGYPCGGDGEPCGTGGRPYFRPNSPITRGQASKIVSTAFFPACGALAR